MTYEQYINNILITRGRFNCGSVYHERHHIIPKCLGGSDDINNLIDLFPQEHYEIHKLLYIEHPNHQGLAYSWHLMCVLKDVNGNKMYNVTAEDYAQARQAFALTRSQMLKGKTIEKRVTPKYLPVFDELKRIYQINHIDINEKHILKNHKYKQHIVDIQNYAKWLRWSHWANLPDSPDKDELIYNGILSLCQQRFKDFDINLDKALVSDIIKFSKRHKIKSCLPINISYQDYEKIQKIQDHVCKKIYFAMLIIVKYIDKNNYMDYRKENNIFQFQMDMVRFKQYACIPPKTDLQYKLDMLIKLNLVKIIDQNKCLIELIDVSNEIPPSEIYMTITNYDCFEEYYQYGSKEKGYKICTRCGAAFKSSCNRNTLCKECSRKSDEFSYRHCEVCGVRFKVTHGNQSNRCKQCEDIYQKQRNIQKNITYRINKKNTV